MNGVHEQQQADAPTALDAHQRSKRPLVARRAKIAS